MLKIMIRKKFNAYGILKEYGIDLFTDVEFLRNSHRVLYFSMIYIFLEHRRCSTFVTKKQKEEIGS
jgi:hypothetical protein